jgi:serine phosphatase RsbU (regulator of sigma subunit)
VAVDHGSWLVSDLASRQANGDDPAVGIADSLVWRLATALARSATTAEVAAALAEHAAPAAGATYSNMAVHDDRANWVRVAHGTGLDTQIARRWAEFSIGEATPLCEAILTGNAVLLSSLEAIGLRYPNLVADTVAASLAATATFPIRGAGGRSLGAVGFAWQEPQRFTAAQLRQLEAIAEMAARALERAMLLSVPEDGVMGQCVAKAVQRVSLPALLPASRDLELAAVCVPASGGAIGGDWYDAFDVDAGICLVIGDVAGHDLGAAAVMAQLRNATRAFANDDSTPARIVTRLNRMLCRLEPDETATVIVAIWDHGTRTLRWSNAGHPPPLRCRRNEFAFLGSHETDLILGADPTWRYQEHTKVMRPGSTVLFYTDGLIERRRNSIGDEMGKLKSTVEGLSDLSPHALCDDVLATRLGSGDLEDDVCLLATRLI